MSFLVEHLQDRILNSNKKIHAAINTDRRKSLKTTSLEWSVALEWSVTELLLEGT